MLRHPSSLAAACVTSEAFFKQNVAFGLQGGEEQGFLAAMMALTSCLP